MSVFNPSKLVVFALIFLTVFFWVQTFYAYWRLINQRNVASINQETNQDNGQSSRVFLQDEASNLAIFSLILTIITVIASYLYQRYGKSSRLKDKPEEPEELSGISDEELLGLFSL